MDNLQNTTNTDKDRARELYEAGADEWNRGNRGAAMSLYAKSAEADPDGPGAQALKMARDIMDFYDKNQFNP